MTAWNQAWYVVKVNPLPKDYCVSARSQLLLILCPTTYCWILSQRFPFWWEWAFDRFAQVLWPWEIHFLNRFIVSSFPMNIGGNAVVIKSSTVSFICTLNLTLHWGLAVHLLKNLRNAFKLNLCDPHFPEGGERVTPRDVSPQFHKKHTERSGFSVGSAGRVGSISKFNHSSPSAVPGGIAHSLQSWGIWHRPHTLPFAVMKPARFMENPADAQWSGSLGGGFHAAQRALPSEMMHSAQALKSYSFPPPVIVVSINFLGLM